VSLLSRYPTLSHKLFELTAVIAGAAYVVGAHGAMTDTAQVFFEKSRATQMRYRRATSSQERELRAAIETLVEASKGSIPSGRPYKDAESIKDAVNARLSKPVGVDAIARRVAKLFKTQRNSAALFKNAVKRTPLLRPRSVTNNLGKLRCPTICSAHRRALQDLKEISPRSSRTRRESLLAASLDTASRITSMKLVRRRATCC
jgi:hypothetical protein